MSEEIKYAKDELFTREEVVKLSGCTRFFPDLKIINAVIWQGQYVLATEEGVFIMKNNSPKPYLQKVEIRGVSDD